MIKKILHIFLFMAAAFTAVAKNPVGDKNSFVAQVGAFYKAQVSKLHKKNLQHLARREFDSLRTSVTIDLANWKYNAKKEKWETMVADPIEVSAFPFSNGNYYYAYNYQTKEVHPLEGDPDATGMLEYNDSVKKHPASNAVLVYEIKTQNMPLLFQDKKFDQAAIDTTIALWESLQKLGYSDQTQWNAFLAINTELGQTIMNDLEQFMLTQDVDHVVVYTSLSEPIPHHGTYSRFRYHNIFSSLGVDSELQETFARTINSFQENESLVTSDLTASVIKITNCFMNNRCDDLFVTEEAKAFWMQFVAAADMRLEEGFYEDHKQRAIDIGTYIDNDSDREKAKALADVAMCYLDSVFCHEGQMDQKTMVAQAAYLTKLYYEGSMLLLASHHLKFDTDITNDLAVVSIADSTLNDKGEPIIYGWEYNSGMSREILSTYLHEIGYTDDTYAYWLFRTGQKDSWENYIYWCDHDGTRQPPVLVTLIARFATGVVTGAYGLATGNDYFTGEELAWWERMLCVLDILPAVGPVMDFSTGILTKVGTLEKGGKIVYMDKAGFIRVKPYHTALKTDNFLRKGCRTLAQNLMVWQVTAKWLVGEKILAILGKNGDEVAKIYPDRIDIHKNYLITESGGTAFKLDDDVDVLVDGQKQNAKFEMVKKGDGEIGLRKLDEVPDNSYISTYGRQVINSLDGFADNINSYLGLHKLNGNYVSLQEFKDLIYRSTIENTKDGIAPLSVQEMEFVNLIRNKIPALNSNTIMQKVTHIKYIESFFVAKLGEPKKIGGYVTTAQDSKHLKNYQEIFDGMRLDYHNSIFVSENATECVVIRFKSNTSGELGIPKNKNNGGVLNDPDINDSYNKNLYPFTGHGFTSGQSGTLGVPEWKAEYGYELELQNGAEMYIVDNFGNEKLIAVYDATQFKFIKL
ncbi:MAG TPA: hypothetical protein VK177_09695 [Flavobacteriales bacterium]|nr:hypothetical protein [Flavobacteriales bacterium]